MRITGITATSTVARGSHAPRRGPQVAYSRLPALLRVPAKATREGGDAEPALD